MESSFHNYFPSYVDSVVDIHFVVGVNFVEVSPKVSKAEASRTLVVDMYRRM